MPYPFNAKTNLKNLSTVLFLKAQGIGKSFCFCLIGAFVRRSQIFSILGKENKFILQFTAIFNKQNVY